MSRLSVELLQRWDEDPDAGYRVNSPFTMWWTATVERSVAEGADEVYRACVESLDAALTYTIHATQSDVRSSSTGLKFTMQAMELLRSCDPRAVPEDSQTFDLEDLDQAILLVAFQFDAVMGTEKWVSSLTEWFSSSFRAISGEIELGTHSLEVIKSVVDDGENTDFSQLDDVHWVLAMLEWFKLEDPRRNIGLNLDSYRVKLALLERDLRSVFPKLKRAKAVLPDKGAPKSFWWRH